MAKNADKIKLSILILSIPSRFNLFQTLSNKILNQIGEREDVEMLSIVDNKSLHIHEKRNELLRIARGSHIAFLDDDDDISDDYIEKITSAITNNPEADVVSFNQTIYLDGKEGKVFAKMGNPQEGVVDHPTNPAIFKDTLRLPWHWCVWKRSLACSEEFRLNYVGGQSCEDIDWLNRLYPKVSESVYLQEDCLHTYRYSSSETESKT